MQKAMEFYMEAFLVSEELPTDFDDYLTRYGSEERKNDRKQRESNEAIRLAWESDTLKLEPGKDFDGARPFLAECAEKESIKARAWFQSCNQVLDAIRVYQDGRPKGTGTAASALSGAQLIESFMQKESDGTIFYAIPRWLLNRLVIVRKRQEIKNARARAKKGWDTRKAGP